MAISRPPDVCASQPRCTSASSTLGPTSRQSATNSRFRSTAPGMTPSRKASSAPAKEGRASAKTSAASLLCRAMRIKCPNSPKPVISVQAEASAAFMASAAALLSVAIESAAAAMSSALPRPICSQKARTPVPSGLVNTSTSSARGVSSAAATAGSMRPVIAKPSLISSSLMLCPPTSATPASANVSMAPFSIRYMISPSRVSEGKARMLKAVRGSPPIA